MMASAEMPREKKSAKKEEEENFQPILNQDDNLGPVQLLHLKYFAHLQVSEILNDAIYYKVNVF